MNFTPFETAFSKAFANNAEKQNTIKSANSNHSLVFMDGEKTLAIYRAAFDHDGNLGLFVEFATSKVITFEQGIDYFIGLAKYADAKFIKFKSHRKGMKKVALSYGFKVLLEDGGLITYQKEVNYG